MRIPSSPTLKQVCRCFWCNYAKLRRKRHSFTCWCVNICDCTAITRDKDRDSDWNTLIRTLSPTSMSGVISQVPSWTSFRYASAELDPLHLHYILYPCAPHTFCNWGRQLRLQHWSNNCAFDHHNWVGWQWQPRICRFWAYRLLIRCFGYVSSCTSACSILIRCSSTRCSSKYTQQSEQFGPCMLWSWTIFSTCDELALASGATAGLFLLLLLLPLSIMR